MSSIELVYVGTLRESQIQNAHLLSDILTRSSAYLIKRNDNLAGITVFCIRNRMIHNTDATGNL